MIKTHSVDVELAKKVGFEEANVLGYIAYWVKFNKDNDKNLYDGRYWTYNTTEALAKQFPYWTTRQIRWLIDKLESMGAIKKGNYNKNKFDRTAWYSLGDEFMYLIEDESDNVKTKIDLTNTKMDLTKMENGFDKNRNSIKYQTNSKPITDTVNHPPLPPTTQKSESMPLPKFLDGDLWEQYLAYKKERKEKLSKQGIAMKFSEWAKWHSEGIDVNECIREAMANEWQGVFKPKTPDKSNNGRNVPNNEQTNPYGLSQGTLNTMRAFREFEAQLIASGQGHRVGGNYDNK